MNKGVFLILYKNSKILFLQRKDNKYYSFPAGKVENNEDSKNAAIRELYEELGLKTERNHLLLKHKIFFSDRENYTKYIGYFYEVLKYTGIETLKEPHKHIEFSWIDKNNLSKNISPYCIQALNMIEQGILESEFIINNTQQNFGANKKP